MAGLVSYIIGTVDSHGLEGSQFVGDHHDVMVQHWILLP